MDFATGVELVANLMAIIGCSFAFAVWAIAFLKNPTDGISVQSRAVPC
jgi:hypothetical protein